MNYNLTVLIYIRSSEMNMRELGYLLTQIIHTIFQNTPSKYEVPSVFIEIINSMDN